MRAFAVDNREFEVAIKRRGIYQVPSHGGIIHHRLTSRVDLNHLVRLCIVEEQDRGGVRLIRLGCVHLLVGNVHSAELENLCNGVAHG